MHVGLSTVPPVMSLPHVHSVKLYVVCVSCYRARLAFPPNHCLNCTIQSGRCSPRRGVAPNCRRCHRRGSRSLFVSQYEKIIYGLPCDPPSTDASQVAIGAYLADLEAHRNTISTTQHDSSRTGTANPSSYKSVVDLTQLSTEY